MTTRFAKLAGAAVAGALLLGAPVSATLLAPTAFAGPGDTFSWEDYDDDGYSNGYEDFKGTDPQDDWDHPLLPE